MVKSRLNFIFSISRETLSNAFLKWTKFNCHRLPWIESKTSGNEPLQLLVTNEHYHPGYGTLSTLPLQYTETKLTIITNTSTDKAFMYSLFTVNNGEIPFLDCWVYLWQQQTTDRQFTENPHIPTDYSIKSPSNPTIQYKAVTVWTLTRTSATSLQTTLVTQTDTSKPHALQLRNTCSVWKVLCTPQL